MNAPCLLRGWFVREVADAPAGCRADGGADGEGL